MLQICDALLAVEAAFLRVENLRIHDNHSSGASIRLRDCRFARVERCTIENYQRVATDDRTTNPLYGYAFRCLDGNGILVRGGRGHQLLDNRIIEQRLLPTREVKERHRLGELVEGRQPKKFGELGREMERTRFARNWGGDPAVSGSYAIRIDRGQLASNPGIRDALVQGNIVTDAGKDGVLVDGKVTFPKPRYRYAFYMELPNAGEAGGRYPKNIHVLDNLFDAGAVGIANVPLPYRK